MTLMVFSARNEKLGQEAVEQLKKELGAPHGEKIRFRQLDVTKVDSIESFKNYIKTTHDGIGVLVSNAGVTVDDDV